MGNIAVLGATGVYARHLIPRLAEDGHVVTALVRSADRAATARALGAEVRIADIFDADSLTLGLAGAELCINLATALPGPSGRGSFADNDRLRRDGVPVLLMALEQAGVPRLIQQSIAMIASSATPTDGTISPDPQGDGPAASAFRAALEMERAVQASATDWMILRGGLFYGPGTGFDETWFAQAATGKLTLPGDGSEIVSLIHISDMAAATARAVTRWHSRSTIAITDDAPVSWHDLFTHIATLAGGPTPQVGGPPRFPSFPVSNARARDLLGWRPHFASYRSGLAR
ncbi:dTDP-glucose 4,6-dehydratase [Primorskyibacter flagellatus]|uniref:dTDP-glucose 4,6-dehydratase n=1 Tax=Primorskyibacter flagellatus TaxID=1387277 RepID=A0A917A9G7_9RHOB|nr:NAD(P)H-binding protein [Primorskyibacter flagellatus]GGE33159.1 dTDP-glucose 4,6-dehydratase [Primorskyibacter flagellatus]